MRRAPNGRAARGTRARIRWVLGGLLVTLIAAGCSDRGDVGCRVGDEIPAAERSALERAALEVLEALTAGGDERLLDLWHSGALARSSLEERGRQLAGLRRRIRSRDGARVVRLRHVRLAGGESVAVCGADTPEDPRHEQIYLGEAALAVGLVTLQLPGDPVAPSLIVQLRHADAAWRLWSADAGDWRASGRDAADFEALADESRSGGDLVAAYVLYSQAEWLALEASYVTNASLLRLQGKLEETRRDPVFRKASFAWSLDGAELPIERLGVITRPSGHAVEVRYRSSSQRGAPGTREEAERIRRYLASRHPVLAEAFPEIRVSALPGPGSAGDVHRHDLPLRSGR